MPTTPHYPLVVASANGQIATDLTQMYSPSTLVPSSSPGTMASPPWPLPIGAFSDNQVCFTYCASGNPQMVIADIDPGPHSSTITGLDLITGLHDQFPFVIVIALCQQLGNGLHLCEALRKGALTYLIWPQDKAKAMQVIDRAHNKRVFIADSRVLACLGPNTTSLADPQKTILDQAIKGKSVDAIARDLQIDEDTVLRLFADIIFRLHRMHP